MKGGASKYWIIRPIREPRPVANKMAMGIANGAFIPDRSSTAMIMAVVEITAPTDKSIPPEMITTVIPILYMVAVGMYGLWGALRTWQGKDFRYLIIGTWLEKSGLWKETPPPEKDKR